MTWGSGPGQGRMFGESPEPEPERGLKNVATAANEFEAGIIVAVLRDAGIEAMAFGAVQQALPLSTRFTRVPVQVPAEQLHAAHEALRRHEAELKELDWSSVDVGGGDHDDDEASSDDAEGAAPLRAPRSMPLLPRLGFWLALIVVVMLIIAFTWISLTGRALP